MVILRLAAGYLLAKASDVGRRATARSGGWRLQDVSDKIQMTVRNMRGIHQHHHHKGTVKMRRFSLFIYKNIYKRNYLLLLNSFNYPRILKILNWEIIFCEEGWNFSAC